MSHDQIIAITVVPALYMGLVNLVNTLTGQRRNDRDEDQS